MSFRLSNRLSGRMGARGSLLVAALMLAVLGVTFSQSIVPAYHEHQTLKARAAELDEKLEVQKEEIEQLQGEIDALSDPYDLANVLRNKYNWKPAPQPKPVVGK